MQKNTVLVSVAAFIVGIVVGLVMAPAISRLTPSADVITGELVVNTFTALDQDRNPIVGATFTATNDEGEKITGITDNNGEAKLTFPPDFGPFTINASHDDYEKDEGHIGYPEGVDEENGDDTIILRKLGTATPEPEAAL